MKKLRFDGFHDQGRTYSGTFARKLEDGSTELYDVVDVKIGDVIEVDDDHAAKLLKAHAHSGKMPASDKGEPIPLDKAGKPTGAPAFVAVK